MSGLPVATCARLWSACFAWGSRGTGRAVRVTLGGPVGQLHEVSFLVIEKETDGGADGILSRRGDVVAADERSCVQA